MQEKCQLHWEVASAGWTGQQNVAPGLNETWSSGASKRTSLPEWQPIGEGVEIPGRPPPPTFRSLTDTLIWPNPAGSQL